MSHDLAALLDNEVARKQPRLEELTEYTRPMNLEVIKEELRNKRGALVAGTLAAGVALAAAGVSSIVGFGVIVAAVACGLLGATDWSLGRKLAGGLFCAFAFVLFLFGAGAILEISECWQEARSEAAIEKCRDIASAASTPIRWASGVALLLLLINPMTGWWGRRERLQKPGTFAARYGGQEQTKIPNRWFSKEEEFEAFVLEELDHAGIPGRQRYEWICDVRGLAPERFVGGARYDWKARQLLKDAPWQSVYDLVERCWPILGFLHRGHFERRVNEYLREAQVGWMFGDGKWTRIGDEIGTTNLERAADACEELGAEDALHDLRNA